MDQGSDHCTKPDEVQEIFGQCSQAQYLTLGDGAVHGQELNAMILVGSFQFSLLWDSVTS